MKPKNKSHSYLSLNDIEISWKLAYKTDIKLYSTFYNRLIKIINNKIKINETI